MSRLRLVRAGLLSLALISISACQSPYYADRGAVYGGLGGAGLGALVGSASGNAGAGAAIGAAAGALTGAAVGQSLDTIEARNRAQIASQMGRQISPGAVKVEDVIGMSQAGVNEQLIVTHIQSNGMARPLQPNDLIILQQQGVSPRVVQAMQQPPVPGPVMVQGGQPVMVAQPMVAAPVYYPPPPMYCPPPSVGIGVGFRSR